MSDYGNHEVVDENVHPQSICLYSPRPVDRSIRSHTRTPSPNVRRTRDSRSRSRSPDRRYRKRSPVARSLSPYNGGRNSSAHENPELSHNLGIHGLVEHDDHEVLDEVRPSRSNGAYSPRPASSRYASRSPPARRTRKSRSRSPTRYRQRSPVPHHRRSNFGNRENGHSKPNRETPEPSRCLGVFGLSMSTDENELREVFGRYGAIEMVKIIYDAQTRQSRGFGFVYFENEGDASKAKDQCDGLKLGGRQIRVDFSMTQRAHSPTPGYYMGKKSRSRFGEGDRRDGGRGYDRSGYGRSRDAGHDDRDRRGGGFDRRRRSPSYGDRSGGDRRMRYSRSHSRSPPRQRHYR